MGRAVNFGHGEVSAGNFGYRVMNFVLFTAAGLSLVWCLVHFFVGGRDVARPLRADRSLDPMVRDVLWFCWHIVSVVLLLMAVFFGLDAVGLTQGLALAATLLSLGIMMLGILSVPMIGQSYRVVPQGWLFVPTTVLGVWGLLG
ncbi:hypothetical protein Q4577_10140 [Marinovum sp. 2_MG-2023]|uniref:hypothetical protein n=1 Tax=unclassified Marinovum TaxID=2647166 RepID=UPI0026E16DBF|nr:MULTISPECIES: hypothetical protein [unclassified Marinovum]MDO6730380.1 hypothetical protein [Marinovum sp. 2_MG-2023]MDO6778360.1 hypothetical protein [Marinovum sp. 1_MG-2023]